MGAFVISPLPSFLLESVQTAGSLRSTGITPLHSYYRPLRHHPKDGFVDRLSGFSFLPPCYPSYRALAFALVRLFLTEYASLPWTHLHAGLSRRTRIFLLVHHCGSVPVHHTHQSLQLKMQPSESSGGNL